MSHHVQLEVAGPLAMFTRPDTGGTPTSYPIPTWSGCKGIFESIAFLSDGAAWINPVKVAACRRVGEAGGRLCYQRYTTNYGGPLRKTSLLGRGTAPGGSSMQLFATVLSDVCYRLHGIVEGKRQSKGVDARHFLRDLFERRLRQGRCFRTPCFGWSEFTCSYWGPFRCEKIVRHDGELEDNEAWKAYCKEWNLGFRDETEVDDALSMEIPSMVLAVWGQPTRGNYAPTYRQDVRIREGVLEFDLPAEWGRELDLQEASGAE